LALTNYLHVHGLKQDYNLSYRVYLDSLKPDFIQDDHHGLLDKEDETNNGVERHENHYNQDKWTYVSNMKGK